MTPIVLVVPVPRTADGWNDYDDNFTKIQEAINTLISQVVAVSGDGAELILNVFDRPGIISPTSYVLNIKDYEGGSQIDIGRSPAPDTLKGETDISYAWGTFGEQLQRVQQTGDVTLDAAAIVDSLPKYIYVGIGSSGTAQLFEDNLETGVLYIYKMKWDGFQLSEFTRLGHYLHGYGLTQAMAARPAEISVVDKETQWTSDAEAEVRIPLHGSSDSNGVSRLDLGCKLVGGYVDVPKAGPGAMSCPAGSDNKLKLRFMLDGVQIHEDDIEIDVSNAPDRVYFSIDSDALGRDQFVMSSTEVKIERVSIGADVVSARGCVYGLFLEPVFGIQIPKDGDSVDQV